MMQLALACSILVASSNAFQVALRPTIKSSALHMGTNGMDLTGNSWKPDSAKMGSTDTGDYFPEGYDPNDQVAFSEGMGGSQAMLGGGSREVQLPGMDFNDDGVMMGGIETASEIPAGMTFIPSSVPDGVIEMNVASSSSGKSK
jgi:hypothetical protein